MVLNPNTIKRSLKKPTSSPSGFNTLKHQAEAERIELQARLQFLDLRQKWSSNLITWINGLLFFQIVCMIFVGTGIWSFHNNDILMLGMVEIGLYILGMGVIIIKFLYPSSK